MTVVNFNGLNASDAKGSVPPDPNGEIGDNHFLQATNGGEHSLLNIFDKQGNSIKKTDLSAFFSTAKSPTNSFGDPVVLYDQAAKRWFVEEYSDSNFLVAVSATPDPLGAWNAYQFKTPGFEDYSKWGIWNNAYFATTNETDEKGNSLPNSRTPIYCINRDQMLAGAQTVTIQRVSIPKFNNKDVFQVSAPVDWEGTNPPPPTTPLSIMRMHDQAWDNSGEDALEIWSVNLNWQDPSLTVSKQSIPTAIFNSHLCSDYMFSCISQPNGVSFDAQEAILMHRVQYRNFGDHESIVLNHVVDITGNAKAGIRWYELRKSGTSSWAIYQQGTFAPDTLYHRFLGSISINSLGDIAMGYNKVGKDISPSLFLTARKATDPLGVMTSPEVNIATGLSYLDNNSSQRWGDYANMSTDPTDDKTFWFTGEYLQARSNWATKIVSFTIESATPTTELHNSLTLSIAPNPTTGNINITAEGTTPTNPIQYQTLNIYGSTQQSGVLDRVGDSYQKSLDLSPLPNGMYFIQISQNTQSKTIKIIKQN